MIPLLGILFACRPPTADPALVATARLSAPIPTDPRVQTGVMKNGMTWFVQHNEQPDDRVVLRLVVDAGSILEDEDQRGIAHLVEHMAFNGTDRFPGNGVVQYLESIGASFGPHVNAHTSFDETVYKLTVPSNDPVALGRALDVLEDWAGGISFDPAAVDGERGVVLEEWRRNQGAGFRLMLQTLSATYGEAYANRLPIGTRESLETFDPAVVSRFYRDWYRPELMAVIAVGDVDADAMAAELVARFGDLKSPDRPRERVRVDMPSFAERKVLVVTDAELTATTVSYGRVFDDREGNTHAHARQNAVEQLMLGMLGERLGDLSRSPDRPFLSAGAGPDRLSPTQSARFLNARARKGGAERALEAVLTEWVRAMNHGFNPGELTRAKAEELAGWDERLAQIDDQESVGEAEELVRVFTNGEYYTAMEYE
nr:insulinase family protein [Deltaproteobacteria bacterium]